MQPGTPAGKPAVIINDDGGTAGIDFHQPQQKALVSALAASNTGSYGMFAGRVRPGLFSTGFSHSTACPTGIAHRPRARPFQALTASETMSMRQPVSLAASLAFWPSLPIARDSW